MWWVQTMSSAKWTSRGVFSVQSAQKEMFKARIVDDRRAPGSRGYNPYSSQNFSIIDFGRPGCMVLYKDSGMNHAICV